MGRLRGRFTVAGLLALVALSHAGCGEKDPSGRLRRITGRVEAPSSLDLNGVGVYAMKNGLMVPWGDTPKSVHEERGGLTFDLPAWGDEHVDLVVANFPSGGSMPPADQPNRRIWLVGDHEGYLANVRPGSTDVLIRLQPVRRARLTVRALDLEGRPMTDAGVSLESHADWIGGKTDANGHAVFDEVPVRMWRVGTEPPRADYPRAVGGAVDVVPSGQVVDVPLRRAVAIRLRANGTVPHDAFLSFGDAHGRSRWRRGWQPEADGSVVLAADPDWSVVEVWVMRHTRRDETGTYSETLAKFTVPVREGATAEFDLGK